LDLIRERCRWVAGEARSVRIDPDGVSAYAESLAASSALRTVAATSDPGRHRIGDDETTAAFVISLDAINFGSGWFPTIRKRPGMSGYHTIASAWREHHERDRALGARSLTELTRADCCAIFDQVDDEEEPATELMELYTSALNDLGAFVLEEHEGSFLALVAAAGHSADALVGILDRMPYFHDVAEYHGVDVPLYKRAQIAALDLSVAFDGQGPGRFVDLDRLTMFADNLVPHVLRVDGVLDVDADLGDRIDAGTLIAPGTDQEIELRACAVHAVELLVAAVGERGVETTAGALDTLLWNRGAAERYKSRPRHRTRTVAY
jgi:Potential Queuosine, Q, salvage protein family